jgi:phosphotriesterase-related protein
VSAADAIVQTVTGPQDAGELGVVLMHEHVITASPGLREAYPSTFPRTEIVATCVEQLQALKATGVDTLVDHTTYDLGRDVELLAEVSQASGVAIVAATGVWIEPQRFWHQRAPVETAELLIAELEQGIAGTGIRAGVIKCALDTAGLARPGAERVLRACAIAHRATGVHISTHTHAARRNGLDQQRIFAEEGVDLQRVVIGHSGDTTELDYLRELLAAGSYLGMDRFGVEDVLADGERMDVVAALCRAGHAERLLLSHDASCWNDRTPMEALQRLRPHHHHRHVVEHVVPGLRERGVSEQQVEALLEGNPRAIFAAAAPYPGPPTAAASRNAWD